MDTQTAKEYAEKIGRITTEYHQLTQREEKHSKGDVASLEEIKERKINIYKYIKRKAVKCTDKKIAFATLSFTPKMLQFLPDEFKKDKRFFFEAIKATGNPKLLKYSESAIRHDIQCCISAVKLDHTLISYVPETIRKSDAMITVYEWSKDMHSDVKNSEDINLSRFGPDADDIFFSHNTGSRPEPIIPSKSDSNHITHAVEKQWDEEPDYEESNSSIIKSNESDSSNKNLNEDSSFQDLPAYSEKTEAKHVNNKDFKKNSTEVDTVSFFTEDSDGDDGYINPDDSEATIMPNNSKKKTKEKPKGFLGLIKRFFS